MPARLITLEQTKVLEDTTDGIYQDPTDLLSRYEACIRADAVHPGITPLEEQSVKLGAIHVEAPFAIFATRYITSVLLSINKVHPSTAEPLTSTGAALGCIGLEAPDALTALVPFTAQDCLWGMRRYLAQYRSGLHLGPYNSTQAAATIERSLSLYPDKQL